MDGNEKLIECFKKFSEIWADLIDKIYENNMEEIVSCKYPFDKSFDEKWFDVNEWIYETICQIYRKKEKNYKVTLEFEYWTHAETEEEAIKRSIPKLIEDMKGSLVENFAEIKVREIDEEGNMK